MEEDISFSTILTQRLYVYPFLSSSFSIVGFEQGLGVGRRCKIRASGIKVHIMIFRSAMTDQSFFDWNISGWPLRNDLQFVFTVSTMKILFVALSAFLAVTSAIDAGAFGERALNNLNHAPVCAQICIINPKFATTYAPETSSLPFGKEYGKALCENAKYQEMLDNCFKKRCSDKNRKKVL